MAREPKTKPTKASVAGFIAAIANDKRRGDAEAVARLLGEVTGEKPVLWGESIVGFGSYESPTGDWPLIGFSPRKANTAIYLMDGVEQHAAQVAKLGKVKTAKVCLYVTKLADVDLGVLRAILRKSWDRMRAQHSAS